MHDASCCLFEHPPTAKQLTAKHEKSLTVYLYCLLNNVNKL